MAVEGIMHCISISHKKTPLKIREKFAFTEAEAVTFGKRVLRHEEITGVIVLSTCNRCEIYFSGDKNSLYLMETLLCGYKKVSHTENIKYFLKFSGENVLKHLFMVASGMDSMVIGEDEILRQVKDAYQIALVDQFTSHELNIVFQSAINSAKIIKTDTGISNIPVSIGTLTANCAEEFLRKNSGNTVLIVGIAGTMGNIVAKNLSDKGDFRIIGTSRSHNRTSRLFVQYDNIDIVEYSRRYEYLRQADVIVSATRSPHYTFTYDVTAKIADGRERLFLDLAVPGDIDKEIQKLKGCRVLDMDYFEQLSGDNNRMKLQKLDKVRLLIEQHVEETLKNVYLQGFQNHLEEISDMVKEKGFPYLLYHLKDKLTSEQMRILLDSIMSINKGEK